MAIAPSEDKKPVFFKIYKRSGHRTIPIYFFKESTEEERKNVLQIMSDLGATDEGASPQVYAIDLEPGIDFIRIVDALKQFEDGSFLEARYSPQPQPPGTSESLN